MAKSFVAGDWHLEKVFPSWKGDLFSCNSLESSIRPLNFGGNTMLKPPSDDHLIIRTDRLVLEPIKVTHANEMVTVLSDLQLYDFIPQDPPDLGKLEKTYEVWARRISPDKTELWLNWAARWKDSDKLIGHFQVGYKPDEASIAYTVGLNFQRRGFALEALQEIIRFLKESLRCKTIKAWIDTRNKPSIELVKKLGMSQVNFIPKADHFKGADSDEFVFELVL